MHKGYPGMEEYLETIYNLSLSKRGEPVKTVQLSKILGVKPSSVTSMIRRLSEEGYVEYRPYSGVILTEKGRRIGRRIVRRHRLVEIFLSRVLKMKSNLIHGEACRMEHGISSETERLLCIYLDQPDMCPHGSYIPPCDYNFSTCSECIQAYKNGREDIESRDVELVPLTHMDKDMEGRIAFIRGKGKILRRLIDMGLTPGTRIKVLNIGPMEGPIEIEVRGSRLALGRELARNIFLERG